LAAGLNFASTNLVPATVSRVQTAPIILAPTSSARARPQVARDPPHVRCGWPSGSGRTARSGLRHRTYRVPLCTRRRRRSRSCRPRLRASSSGAQQPAGGLTTADHCPRPDVENGIAEEQIRWPATRSGRIGRIGRPGAFGHHDEACVDV
jgi:hypothetical protein